MKIDRDAYLENDEFEDSGVAYAHAFGTMKADFERLIEKVNMGDNPIAKEYVEELREKGFIED